MPKYVNKDWWNPIGWFQQEASTAGGWLGGLGGDIASGIEGGFIATVKDIWIVILPFIEIGIGTLIAMWAISLLFDNEGIQILSFAAKAAV